MKRLLILFLLGAAHLGAAITEYYVNDAGSGTADGTSEANAMSFATFTDYMSAAGSYTAAAGDRFNIKGAITSRTTTADTWSNAGTSTSPIIVRGYGTTIGDLATAGRTNGNGALITTNFPTITYTTGSLAISGNYVIIETLKIDGGRNGILVNPSSNWGRMVKCAITNTPTTGTSGEAVRSGGVWGFHDCDFANVNGGGAGLCAFRATSEVHLIGCRITSAATGVIYNSGSFLYGNTIFKCVIGIDVQTSSSPTAIVGNTIAGGSGDGIQINSTYTSNLTIANNCITDNGGYGIDFQTAASTALLINNRTRDNTSGAINLGTDWVAATNYAAVTTDTGGATTDYTNVGAGTEDYTLISTSPAAYVGLPLYASIGALQRNASAGSGGQKSFSY